MSYRDVVRLEDALGCPEPVAWVLARRGLSDPAEARDFLAADGPLGDPQAIAGVGEAAALLREAIARGEHVAVHGGHGDKDTNVANVGLSHARLDDVGDNAR